MAEISIRKTNSPPRDTRLKVHKQLSSNKKEKLEYEPNMDPKYIKKLWFPNSEGKDLHMFFLTNKGEKLVEARAVD